MISHVTRPDTTTEADPSGLAESDPCHYARLLSREDLLTVSEDGREEGRRLASSPLSTATAISALVLAEQHGVAIEGSAAPDPATAADRVYQGELSELIVDSLHRLAECQNADGGWGDLVGAPSTVSTTMVVCAAFHLTGVPARYSGLLEQADAFVAARGGPAGFKRRRRHEKMFTATVLTNCALADMVPWRMVPPLAFEWGCLPARLRRWLPLDEDSVTNPAYLAIGLARLEHAPPSNPVLRAIRTSLRSKILSRIRAAQSPSGGFLDATPLTSFIVMNLATIGYAEHAIVRRGVEYLLESVGRDATWPLRLRNS